MPPDERDAGYLWDMRRYAAQTAALVAGITPEQFRTDDTTRMAIERCLEIIGEAARRVSPDFQLSHPEIPWRRIVGLRNVLIHQYGQVDVEALWVVASESASELVELLDRLIPPDGSDAS